MLLNLDKWSDGITIDELRLTRECWCWCWCWCWCGVDADIGVVGVLWLLLLWCVLMLFVDDKLFLISLITLISACWVSLCLRRSTFRWNARPQTSQANGLNPVCFLEWVIKLDDWLNALPHTEHLCGFSPN